MPAIVPALIPPPSSSPSPNITGEAVGDKLTPVMTTGFTVGGVADNSTSVKSVGSISANFADMRDTNRPSDAAVNNADVISS